MIFENLQATLEISVGCGTPELAQVFQKLMTFLQTGDNLKSATCKQPHPVTAVRNCLPLVVISVMFSVGPWFGSKCIPRQRKPFIKRDSEDFILKRESKDSLNISTGDVFSFSDGSQRTPNSIFCCCPEFLWIAKLGSLTVSVAKTNFAKEKDLPLTLVDQPGRH